MLRVVAACKRGAAGPAAKASQPARSPFSSTAASLRAEEAAKEGAEASKGAGGWLKEFAAGKLRLFVAVGLGVLAVNAGASSAFDWYYHRTVLDTLVRGVLPPPQPPPLLPREELCARVQALVQPNEPSPFYYVVTGPPGGGKSTLLRQAVRRLGGGVGYVDVGPAFDVDWGRDLGNAFNFRFQEHVTRLNIVSQPVLGTKYEDPRSKHPLASLRQSAEALHDAAADFKRHMGRPFVLVIDSANRLAGSEGGERLVGALREYARDWAQEGVITTVFVAHDWDTVERLTGDHPAQSRAGPVLRVPDIGAEESLAYLRHLGVRGKVAEQCAGVAGGSLLLLQRCASMLKEGASFAEVKQQMFDVMEQAYRAAGLLDQTPQREGGLAVVRALLRSSDGTIGAAEWREHVPLREGQRELLGRGVLQFDGRRVAFASNLAAAYAAERLRARLPPSVWGGVARPERSAWWRWWWW